LFSVDGVSVSHYPFLVLEGRIRGKAGSAVSLGIVSSGVKREVEIQRAAISRASAELMPGGNARRIRIWRFDANTLEQLAQCLSGLDSGEFLILDLRGNVGGDLKAAVACAELFLAGESLIVTLENRDGAPRVFRASREDKKYAGKLAIWQDAFTASASEVFCAALHDNGVARTFGQTSFGKGVAQSIIPAGDKDFFVITTGLLLRPSGTTFHHEGLKPDYYVSDSRTPVEQNYLRKTYEIFGLLP
jgi:carboxyl-terminal processing protease